MTPPLVLTTHSLIAIGYAIPLLFAPEDFIWLYGATADVEAAYLARLLGAALAALAAIAWIARDAPEGDALDAICVGFAVGNGLALLVSLHHQLTHPDAGLLGWTSLLVYAGFSAAYALLWLQRGARRAAPRLQAG